ncbi:DUF815 domain-containing protein [Pseudomonas sp. DSP3-2-2]|uniref:DUF815 domain-containing protein n=1 Tax=unclassified Pseudomonas TaxID=196821 RepID=UPI003CE8CB09
MEAVNQWFAIYDLPESRFEEAHVCVVRWATQRGSKSGRIAVQFAKVLRTIHTFEFG